MTSTAPPHPRYRPSRLERWASTMLTRALRNGRGPRFMRLLTVLRGYLSTPARFFAGRKMRDASGPHPVFELTPVR